MQTISEKIKQRRLQMLVHSFLYYELDYNIVDDYTWSKWAVELAKLQNENLEVSKQVEYYELFKNWDGSSGAHLKYDDNIKSIAYRFYVKETHRVPIIAKIANISAKSVQNVQKSEINCKKLQPKSCGLF